MSFKMHSVENATKDFTAILEGYKKKLGFLPNLMGGPGRDHRDPRLPDRGGHERVPRGRLRTDASPGSRPWGGNEDLVQLRQSRRRDAS